MTHQEWLDELEELEAIAERQRDWEGTEYFLDGVQMRLRPDDRDRLRELRILLADLDVEQTSAERRYEKIRSLTGGSFECPTCHEVRESHRSWVLKDPAMCRSCWYRHDIPEGDHFEAEVFVKCTDRWLTGDVGKLLHETGKSQAWLAKEIGCTQPFVSQLKRSPRYVSPGLGQALLDVLGPDAAFVEPTFRISGESLAVAVARSGLPIREFCRRVDWSRTSYYNAINGVMKTLNGTRVNRIVEVLAERGVVVRLRL